MYQVGWPLWKLLARLGVSVIVKIDVMRDDEANVYIATSPNLRGLVAEANSKEELFEAVHDCIDLLMEAELATPPKHRPLAAWSGEMQVA